MALAGFDRSSATAALTSHDLHGILGGSHAGKLTATGDDRSFLHRSEAMRVHVHNAFGKPAEFVHAVELVDELGAEMLRPTTSGIAELGTDETAQIDLRVPRNLADGFYMYRVTAVARSGHETADAGAEVAFILAGDSMQLLSDEDWMQYSLANEGAAQ